MSKLNIERNACKDVFNAFMVSNANYAGQYEFPILSPAKTVPNKLISFSKARNSTDYGQWIHFYEDDAEFECIWKNPYKYLDLYKNFEGVILPDFSVYRDMPLSMQIWNIYRSRAFGNWLQTNSIDIIPNIRYGDDRTYQICCDGIPKGSGIAIGTHGNMKVKDDRSYLLQGLDIVVERIEPKFIVIYGTAPSRFFQKYELMGIHIYQFDSEFSIAHRGANADGKR